ncbi:hypothetical protein PoB_001341800 [Plakobranchus ocellatus]|uniref:Uncharacterized protein n=1 Tax=Plakobranchus ocellatus TaxID=259542 RepID=A0AAV3YWK1_9GAST|nr:hypothetical protein PoB_001341800 [Plakobranchus ocellatus]
MNFSSILPDHRGASPPRRRMYVEVSQHEKGLQGLLSFRLFGPALGKYSSFCCSLRTESQRILHGFFPLRRGRRGTSAAILGRCCWLHSKVSLDGTIIFSG